MDTPTSDTGALDSYTPSYGYVPGIIRETDSEIFDLGRKETRGVDPIAAYLASLGGAPASGATGGAVRSPYGNLDELLRIVGGR